MLGRRRTTRHAATVVAAALAATVILASPSTANTPRTGQGAHGRAAVAPLAAPPPRSDFNADRKADLLARDGSGVLWFYAGTGSMGGLLSPRVRVGGGWSAYNTVVSPGDLNGDAKSDLLGRDSAGVLWFYAGTGHGAAPFLARVKVGSGWSAYTLIATGDLNGDHRSDLLGRDSAGVLWLFPGTGNGASPFGARLQAGSNWNIYNAIVGPGDLNGDGKPDLLGRDASGELWFYAGTGVASAPFAPRTAIGPNWSIYDALVGPGDLNVDGKPDLLARNHSGKLWFYGGVGDGTLTPRRFAGDNWSIYNALIG